MKTKILIVDDEPLTRNLMARALSPKYDCLTAADAEAAMKVVTAESDLALILTDYKMPGMNGVELIKAAKAANAGLGAILITAFGEIELAVSAMKDGADDFLVKPITDLAQLELRVAKAIKTTTLEREVKSLKSQLNEKNSLAAFTGSSEAMQRVYARLKKVAPSNATVLIEGPSGSGKELAARALHSLSPRCDGPFVAVECSAFPGELLASELFGYMPGTFTGQNRDGKAGCFEAAHGGTIFLDEIGEIDLPTQISLLRVLETKSIRRLGGGKETPVDFRLVAATNRNLAEMVKRGDFREDLYYRLNVIDVKMPALKDHPEDIALLVARFIREFAAANHSPVTGIDRSAIARLERYDWPGNVRQLRNTIEKMVVLAAHDRLTDQDVPELGDTRKIDLRPSNPPMVNVTAPPTTDGGDTSSLAAIEKAKILATLQECKGNKTKAADKLGISRRTLHRKLNEWGQNPNP